MGRLMILQCYTIFIDALASIHFNWFGQTYIYIHLFTIMEADNPLQTLPQRQYNQPVKFGNAQRKQVYTNYFQIKLGGKETSVYQFVFDSQPQIPADSKEMLYQLIKSVRKELKQKISYVTSSGLILWGSKNLSVPLNIKTQFKYQQKTYDYDVIIKPTKTLDTATLLKTNDGKKMVLQLFNNKIKNRLRDMKMDEITRGKYFDKKEVRVQQCGLNILRGYKFTLSHLKNGLFLQIDVCSKVFRAHNLLEEITGKTKDQVNALVGSTVITRYGRIRTYTIQKIDFNLTPKSTFYSDKRAGQISFMDYYLEAYGLKIKDKNQPLVESVLREEKIIKNGVIEKKEIRGFLIPQFLALTGMSDQQRANFQTMKQIAPYTKLTPNERLEQTSKLIQTLNGPEIEIGRPKKIGGYQLYDTQVKLASNNIFKSRDGTLNFKDKVKSAIPFKDWVIAYSQGKSPKYDDKDADELVSLIQQASKAFGLEFKEPGFITADSHVNSWKEEIDKDIQKNGKPQIIVLFFNENQQKFYPDLKRYITCDLKIPCQGLRRRTVGQKSKNPMSAASKLILQMNQKIGGVTWQVIQDEYFEKRKVMYGAFSLSKGKKGFTLAFVGSLNSKNTKVFSQCRIGYKRKEQIPQADFDSIFLNWAKNYVMQNKVGPDLIMIYREGLSIPQIQVQLKPEIDALSSVIKKIGEKTKKANYSPEVAYVVVNKKINTRIFDNSGRGGGSVGKFMPDVTNSSSGTCVFDELSIDNLYDFHLTAQKVTQGTCTPTHYIVVYDKSKLTQENLAQFTYDQCFNYYNWQGAVKVPANMQCADKLAKLVGESIQRDVIDGDVTKSYFFL